jgi:hypothetical protein
VVEPDHLRAAADEFLGVQARPAGRVENPPAGHVAQQRQAGGPVVVRVEEPVAGDVGELIGECVVLRLPPYLIAHASILDTSRRTGN